MAVVTQLPPGSTRTRVVGRQARDNEVTRIAAFDPAVLHRPLATLEDEAEWSETFARLATWRAEHIERDGLAVVVRSIGPNGKPIFDVALAAVEESPKALVVGRHDRCDVTLPAASSGSLRHAAVMLWPGEGDAAPRAIAVDLLSRHGLRTREGRAARRLSSTTALHFGAGESDVFVLVAARDKPFAVRFPDELDAHVSGALVDENAPKPATLPRDAWERSRVFRGGDTRAVRGAEPGLVVRASADDVARGIVLGRYERCHRTDLIASRDVVSRVHALVFAAERSLWIVDTASTGGTTLVDDVGGARTELHEGMRIAPLGRSSRVFLAGTEVSIDVARAD
jgi:hypothetical protein